MDLHPETMRSQYTDEDAAYLEPLGFEGALNRSSFMKARRMKSGRYPFGDPRWYIQYRGRGWEATRTNGQGHAEWRSPRFPDPISAYVHAELVQWRE